MNGKYRTLVIDPPWHIKPLNFKTGGYKPLPYKTMTDKEIMDFPVENFAAPQSTLLLWAPHSKLVYALQLLYVWQYKYKAAVTWSKTTGANVHGIHYNTELALLATRGRSALKRNKPLPLLIAERARQHSRKPDKFYEAVRACTPEPRIDIFGRYRHLGFDGYGDELQPATQRYLIDL